MFIKPWSLMSFINLHIDLYTQTRHKMTVTVPDFLSYLFTSTHSQRKIQNSPSSQTRTKSSWYRYVTMVTRWRLTFQLKLSDFRWGQWSIFMYLHHTDKNNDSLGRWQWVTDQKARQLIKKQRREIYAKSMMSRPCTGGHP